MDDRIAQFRPLVEMLARRQWNTIAGKTWLSLDDLIQAGYVGLLLGLRRYDPAHGALTTYLWPTIHGEIQKEVTEHNHTLRVGQRFKRYASRIRASDTQDDAVLAVKLGITVKEVKAMKEYLATGFQSTEYAYDDDGETFTLHDIVGIPDEGYEYVDIRQRIEAACVSELDRAIIRLREQGYTNTEIVAMVEELPNHRWKRSKNMKQISETLRRVRRRMRQGEQA